MLFYTSWIYVIILNLIFINSDIFNVVNKGKLNKSIQLLLKLDSFL